MSKILYAAVLMTFCLSCTDRSDSVKSRPQSQNTKDGSTANSLPKDDDGSTSSEDGSVTVSDSERDTPSSTLDENDVVVDPTKPMAGYTYDGVMVVPPGTIVYTYDSIKVRPYKYRGIRLDDGPYECEPASPSEVKFFELCKSQGAKGIDLGACLSGCTQKIDESLLN